MSKIEIESAKQLIFANASKSGELSDIASVLIKYVYCIAPDCYFEQSKTAASEWVLRPDNWICLSFSTGYNGHDSKIIISLDVWPENLQRESKKLEIRQGRLPRWSKFTLSHVSEIRECLRLISYNHGEKFADSDGTNPFKTLG